MRSIALAVAILATPVDAAPCRHHKFWYYPWPQQCSRIVTHFAQIRNGQRTKQSLASRCRFSQGAIVRAARRMN